jgi:hypothetical protein
MVKHIDINPVPAPVKKLSAVQILLAGLAFNY